MWQTKLKAGALQVVLSIVITITLLLFAFILLVHLHKKIDVKSSYIIEVTKSTNDAIRYSLNNDITLKDTIATIPLNSDYKHLSVYKDYWGVFEKIIATARIKTYETKKVALIGGISSESNRTALYAQDNNKPLVLVGNTTIKGTSYIPKQGVKPGSIAGQSFYGQQLINGVTKFSEELPELSTSLIENLDTLIQHNSGFTNHQFINLEPETNYSNSFLNRTQIVYSNATIQLQNNQLIGNIIIQSRSKIVVDASSKLEDILLIAPEIEVRNRVKGKFQAIAKQQIKVGEHVDLQYPSALVVYQKEADTSSQNQFNEPKEPNISIANHSTINGVVIYQGKNRPNNYQVQLKLEEQSKVIGELYCNENLELIGTVEGGVFTNNFLAQQSGSIYQNHIYNGRINSTDIPEEYAGLLFLNSKKEIIQWLY